MDAAQHPADPMPGPLVPMAATLAELPSDDAAWGYEIKWDGVRAVAYLENGRLRLFGRQLREFTRQYPEIGKLADQLAGRRAVLDGEVVAFDVDGRPNFQLLQPRIHAVSTPDVQSQQQAVPVVYVVFDLLYLDGRSLLRLGYEDRRGELAMLGLGGPHWQAPDYHRGNGRDLLDATRAQGLEGVVAKRLDSPYRPGKRTREWLKIKNTRRQEVVIGGWIAGQGHLSGTFGALLTGYYENGELRFAGKVGTGFTQAGRRQVKEQLDALPVIGSPFTGRQPQRDSVFVEPRLVAEVEFGEWTSAGTMRHPSFQGLRTDKAAAEVVREEPA